MPEDQQVIVPPKRVESRGQQIYAFTLVTSLFFLWGFAYGLLDVLNKHFQDIFGISKLQSTLLQVAYFGAYVVWAFPAGQIMSRYGYKVGIYMGLGLYSLGAILFWPCAVYASYGGFVACTFVIGCGLGSLEVAANSYISVLGDPKHAAFRLNFSQSFNGVAAFTGPLIASTYFFHDGNENSLTNVQWVYLAVAAMGATVAFLFIFCKLPEISETQLQQELEATGMSDDRPLWQHKRCMFGFVAQLAYVGAQVTLATFVLNYVTEMTDPFSKSEGARLFSYMQITFMVGRFVSTPLLRFFDPAMIVTIYALLCAIFTIVVATNDNRAGLGALYVVFFFESIQFPTIFTIATSDLGKWTKRGSSLIIMGVGGGAIWPPMQGAVADKVGTRVSYWIAFMGYMIVVAYGAGCVIYERRRRKMLPHIEPGLGIVHPESDQEKASTPDHIEDNETKKEKPVV